LFLQLSRKITYCLWGGEMRRDAVSGLFCRYQARITYYLWARRWEKTVSGLCSAAMEARFTYCLWTGQMGRGPKLAGYSAAIKQDHILSVGQAMRRERVTGVGFCSYGSKSRTACGRGDGRDVVSGVVLQLSSKIHVLSVGRAMGRVRVKWGCSAAMQQRSLYRLWGGERWEKKTESVGLFLQLSSKIHVLSVGERRERRKSAGLFCSYQARSRTVCRQADGRRDRVSGWFCSY